MLSEEQKHKLIMDVGFEECFVDMSGKVKADHSRSAASKGAGSAASSSTPQGVMNRVLKNRYSDSGKRAAQNMIGEFDRVQEEKMRCEGEELGGAGAGRASAYHCRWSRTSSSMVARRLDEHRDEDGQASERGGRQDGARVRMPRPRTGRCATRTRSAMDALGKRMRGETTARNATEGQTTDMMKGIEKRVKDLEFKGIGGNEKKESHESAAASPPAGNGSVPRHIILGGGSQNTPRQVIEQDCLPDGLPSRGVPDPQRGLRRREVHGGPKCGNQAVMVGGGAQPR